MLSKVSHELSNQAHLRSERVFKRGTEHGASCCCSSSAPSTRSCTVLQYIILQPTGQYHNPALTSRELQPLSLCPAVTLLLLVVLSFFAKSRFAAAYFFSFGLLAPYLERACFLLATPAVSSVPLTMWYLVPGRSFTLPPRIRTTLCS